MLAPKAAHVLGLTAFERPITEVGGLQGEWLEYATVDSCWLFKSCTILQFIFKGALLANTSIIILPLHRRLHQWLQSLFCVVGFFTTISLDFTSAGFHLSTDPPFPHPFGLGLHEYSPFRCISPCLGSRCSRPEKQKKHIGCGWCGLHNHKMYIYMYICDPGLDMQSMTITFRLRPPCGLVATPSAKIRLGHISWWWLIFFLDLFVHLSVHTVSNVIYNLYGLWHTSKQCICTKSIAWADMFSLNSLSGKGAGI